MTTTTVSDAVILPQSQGTGLSGENATIDAAINGVLNRYVGGEYVASEYSTGLAFQNHDGTNDTVEVGPGIVFVQDNSTSTSGERGSGGNPQAESSTTSGYDTELPEGHTYAVLFPTATEISVSDSTLNEVYVDIDDVTANNSVNLEHDGSTTASPGATSLKIGETNPDDASADTRANDDASPTFDSLTVNGTTTTDALNADSAGINTISNGAAYLVVDDGGTYKAINNNTGEVEDENSSIQPVLDYAASNGGSIELGEMEATLSSEWYLDTNNPPDIRGQGQKKTILKGETGIGNIIRVEEGNDSRAENFAITGLTFDAQTNSVKCLDIDDANRFIISNCRFVNSEDICLNITGDSFAFTTLQNEYYTASRSSGVAIEITNASNEYSLIRPTVYNYDTGINIDGDGTGSYNNPHGSALFNPRVYDSNIGLRCAGVRHLDIYSPMLEGADSYGLRITDNSNGEKSEVVNIWGGWYYDNSLSILFDSARWCSINGFSRIWVDEETNADGIKVAPGGEDIDLSNFLMTLEGSGSINEKLINDGVRTRWDGVIGGGRLGGVQIENITGQFDLDRAVANGDTTGLGFGDPAWWDDTNQVWKYHNNDGTV